MKSIRSLKTHTWTTHIHTWTTYTQTHTHMQIEEYMNTMVSTTQSPLLYETHVLLTPDAHGTPPPARTACPEAPDY